MVVAGGCGYRLVPVDQIPSPPADSSDSAESPTPTPPPVPDSTLQSTQRRVSSGVVRLEVAQCSQVSRGTGFAIADNLVVTVAHLVDESAMIWVIAGKTARAGRVVGIDRSADVALVRLSAPLSGYEFRWAAKAPTVAQVAGTLSYSASAPQSFGRGTVTEINKTEEVGGSTRYGLIQTDAKTVAGSVGGPLFNEQGAVLGLIEAGSSWDPGRTLAISRDVAAPLVERWRDDPQPQPRAECSSLINPQTDSAPKESYSSAEVQAAVTLDLYFTSINNADYATALAQFADSGDSELKEFIADMSTTKDSEIAYQEVRSSGEEPIIWATFISEQATGDGPEERPEETCTRWSVDYRFTRHNGLWLIDRSEAHRGNDKNQV